MKFLAAAVQMLATPDRDRNLREAEEKVREAAARGATVIALPEVFHWRGKKEEERNFAETVPGPTTRRMEGLARELKIYLLAGSILEAIPGDARAYNTSLLFDPGGKVLACYRKMHLFDVDIDHDGSTVRSWESEIRKPGEEIVVADTALCRMGLSVCYDVRFPELFRALVDRGAELVFVPSAFTALTGAAHWEPLLRARAIENLVFIVAPNQMGQNPHSFATYGHSLIVNPWGKILAEASDLAEIIYAEIDLDYLKKVRAELPALSHRKL